MAETEWKDTVDENPAVWRALRHEAPRTDAHRNEAIARREIGSRGEEGTPMLVLDVRVGGLEAWVHRQAERAGRVPVGTAVDCVRIAK